MAELGLADTPAPKKAAPQRAQYAQPATHYRAVPTPQAHDEVDDIMAELGLNDTRGSSQYNNVPLQPKGGFQKAPAAATVSGTMYSQVPSKPKPAAEAEVDDLLADLGLADSAPSGYSGAPAGYSGPPAAGARGGLSSGPGARGGMSSGPGGRGGMSSGPGGRGGMSSGPGGRGGMSSGPGGRGGMSSGPGGRGGGMSSGPGGGAGRGSGPAAPANRIGPLATHTADGREIKHTGPPCARCEEMIIGAVTQALDKQYHPDCFVCVSCQQPFPEGEFLVHEGQPFCDPCHNELFAVRCSSCQQPVTGRCIEVGNKKWHVEHFACEACGTPLAGKPYKEDDGSIFCATCKAARARRVEKDNGMCGQCKMPIIGEYIMLRGQRMHPKHFRCEECGCAFSGGNCHEYEGKLYCKEDYLKLLKDICSFCHKPIIGRSFTALGRVWHPEHFVCYHCKEPLGTSSYMEKDGNPYCELHWHALFGAVCARCDKAIMSGVIRACGKNFHQACFTCSGCDSPMPDGHYEYETKAMCKKCFSKLPADVRKRIETKRKEQIKAEEARAKANKK